MELHEQIVKEIHMGNNFLIKILQTLENIDKRLNDINKRLGG